MAREVALGNVTGPQGPRGVQGETGPTGATGAQGVQGAKGATGATWLTGTVAPTTQGANDDWYLNTTNCDVYQKVSGAWVKKGNIKGSTGTTGTQGVKGDKGDKGDAFSIAKAYVSVAAMNAGYASDGVTQGQFVIIDTGNVQDADNAKLYVKGAASYSYLTDLSGATGMTGPQGAKGDTGAKGDIGAKGATGETGIQGPQGVKGDTGAKGTTGATGATGTQGVQGVAGITPELEIRNGILYAIYSE